MLALYGRYEEAIAKQKQFITEANNYAKIYKENEIAYLRANKAYMSQRGRVGGIQKAIKDIMKYNAEGKVRIVVGAGRRFDPYTGDYDYYLKRK